jgi:hypothetical protein
MAKFNVLNSTVRMELYDIVKYQITTYCYINRLQITKAELDCLTILAISGEYSLTEFCLIATEKRIFKNTQAVRNCVVRLERFNLIVKEGKTNKKKIAINPEIKIQTMGNILVNYKFVHLDPKEAQGYTG